MVGKKRAQSISLQISMIAIGLVIFGTLCVGTLSYFLYRSDTIHYNAEKAIALAQSVAGSIDTERLKTSMQSDEKDDYIDFLQQSFNEIIAETHLAYLYAVEKDYDQDLTYITTGLKPGDEWYGDFKTSQSTTLFSKELLQAIDSGSAVGSVPYVSKGYGTLVSGYAPIYDKDNQLLGVVGVDLNISDVVHDVNMFGLRIIVIILVLCLVFAVFLVRYFGRKIGVPLRALAAASKKIAHGDLSAEVKLQSKDEIGQLAEAFSYMVESTRQQADTLEEIASGDLTVAIQPRSENDTMSVSMLKMVDSLRGMFAEITNSTTHVSSGAQQMADAAQHLAQSSTEQAASIEQVSGAIAQLNEKAQSNIEMAQQAAGLSSNIQQNALTSSQQMHEMTQAVQEISEASSSIKNVIKIIDDIAFQTNILALNAAVEAARAGQHGKGFSVVAEEVRNLAAKSAQAARDTGVLINNTIEKSDLGFRIAQQTEDSLKDIVDGIQETSKLTDDIAASSEEQGISILKINADIENISQVVQQNSATAQQSAASSEEMSGQASILNGLVENFKLENNHRIESRKQAIGMLPSTEQF